MRSPFPTDETGDEAFAYALELFLRTIDNLEMMDGWRMVRLVRETDTSLRAVGIMHVLPAGALPCEVELSRELKSIRYWVRIGVDDDRWRSLSDSKSWNAVYLYATAGRKEEWTWSKPISGCIADP